MMINMRIMNFIVTIMCVQIFWAFTSAIAVATNPVLTHASIDVGNIISIVIPESPDANINIDQLTSDFRRQLERIRQQSRINKLESGLVTLKNVLPEMLREEKRKTFQFLRRGHLNNKNSNQIRYIPSKNTNARIIQRRNNLRYSRRDMPNWINTRNYYQLNHDIVATTKRSIFQMKNAKKYNKKNPKFTFDETNQWNNVDKKNNDNNYINYNDNNNWSKFMRELNRMKYSENVDCNIKDGRSCGKKLFNDVSQNDDQISMLIPSQNQPIANQFWSQLNNNEQQEKLLINDSYTNAMQKNTTDNECSSLIFIDFDGQIYSICNNTKLINIPEVTKDENENSDSTRNNESTTSNTTENDDKIILPINIEVDDFKSVEKIIENPQAALEHMNSSGFNIDDFRVRMNGNMLKRRNTQQPNENLENAVILTSINQDSNQFSNSDDSNKNNKNILEFNQRNRDFTSSKNGNNKQMELTSDGVIYKHHTQKNIPKVTHELNFDNENFEIRIERSMDDNNFQMKKSINEQTQELLMDNNNNKLKPITNEQLNLIMHPKVMKKLR